MKPINERPCRSDVYLYGEYSRPSQPSQEVKKDRLVTILFELYENGDIAIDVFGIANYNSSAIVELQGLLGHMDINRVEESSAFAVLRAHHDALQEKLRQMPDYLCAWRSATGVQQ